MDDLISIIVPIYKVDINLLSECLNSLKRQTYRNIEVFLIFDGANEEIVEFCKKFVKGDKRFISIIRENKGVSFSRNEGIKNATGKWITFVDADDWVEENMCEIFINRICNKDEEYDFIMFRNFINTTTQIESFNCIHNDCIIDKKFKYLLFQSTFGSKFGRFPCCECVWKNFYNREFLIKNNITFNLDLKIGEDMIFNYQVWEKSIKGYYIDKAIYHYRKNGNSVMNSNSKELIFKYETLFEKYQDIVEKLPSEYSENYELFFIRQIERFSIKYFFNRTWKYKEFKELLKNECYSKNIKKAKIGRLKMKGNIFLVLLKLRLYYVLGIICFFISRKEYNW